MNHPELLKLIESHELLSKELEASSLVVWAALARAEPELAGEILRLFSTVNAAAHWVTDPDSELGGSPARAGAGSVDRRCRSRLNHVAGADRGQDPVCGHFRFRPEADVYL